MSNGECWAQGSHTGDGQGSSGHLNRGVEPVVSETIVEQVVAAIGRGESLSGIAPAYGWIGRRCGRGVVGAVRRVTFASQIRDAHVPVRPDMSQSAPVYATPLHREREPSSVSLTRVDTLPPLHLVSAAVRQPKVAHRLNRWRP